MILGEVPHVVYMAAIRQFQETTTTHNVLQNFSWVPFYKSKTSKKKQGELFSYPRFGSLGLFPYILLVFSVFYWLSSHCKKRGRQVKSQHMSFLWIWHLSLISADSKTARRRKCRTYSIAGWRIIPFYVSIFGFIHLYSWWISHWYVIFKVMLQLFRSIPEFKTKQNGWQPSIGSNSTFQ